MTKSGMTVLGRNITGGPHEVTFRDMRSKKAKAWRQSQKKRALSMCKDVPAKRLLAVEVHLLSILLWLCPTWAPSQRLCSELRGFHLYILKKMFPLPHRCKTVRSMIAFLIQDMLTICLGSTTALWLMCYFSLACTEGGGPCCQRI